jgi:hypothetical protein
MSGFRHPSFGVVWSRPFIHGSHVRRKTTLSGGSRAAEKGGQTGRAGQTLELGEPSVMDKATTNSLAADHHGPRQRDLIVKGKPLTWSCLRVLDQSIVLCQR